MFLTSFRYSTASSLIVCPVFCLFYDFFVGIRLVADPVLPIKMDFDAFVFERLT